jgi:hypothetical protein
MRHSLALLAAGALFLSPVLAESLLGQQPAAPATQQPAAPQTPAPQGGVQVGVPQGGGDGAGRQGGGRQGGGGGGRGGRQAGPPPGPAPRNAAGRVILGGATPKEKVLWVAGLGITAPAAPVATVPFQPWAKALYDDRQTHELEPHARCKASGFTRQFLTPYGAEIVELPEIQRMYIFDVGGPHTFRTIYMDGRSHPKDLKPTYYGHSIGWWEGDTLVIDTKGFVESFWWDRRGLPHTEQLHTVERLTRTNQQAMTYEFTVDDPGAYTKPFTASFALRWIPDTELFEYVCQQANYAHELMVGQAEKVDRSTTIIP